MSAPITQKVRWQDLTVKNEVDIVLEIARQEGWKDCEIFGYGDMITQPQESMGWELIPADLYKYSIPVEGIRRLHRIINADVRIQGVIIADDQRKTESPPEPARPRDSMPAVTQILSFVRRALIGLVCIAAVIALVGLFALSLIYFTPFILLGLLAGFGSSVDYDPKLVILVDDGKGSTVWISVFTWYE